MEASPFLIQADASGEALEPIAGQEKAYDEAWLQGLLRKHPDILPAAEIEPVFHPLISIGCEVGTDTGSIDNLFISPRGYLVLVETKLWRNPQAKREVVAQAIDYAASLSRWTYSKLDAAVQAYLKSYENVEMDLLSWVEQRHGPVEGGRHFFEETVAKNLRLGRFLTMIVGDRIRQSLVDMLNYINRYPHLATDVALVEMHCFRWRRGEDWPLLVVPRVMAQTQVVERSVIQVTVKRDGGHEVEVRQERAGDRAVGSRRVTLSEEAFWELLMEQAPDDYEAIRSILDEIRQRDGIDIRQRESSLVARIILLDTERPPSLFFVDKTGCVNVWPDTIRSQLGRAGLDRNLARPYVTRMRKILNVSRGAKHLLAKGADVDVTDLLAAVDAFVEAVRRAAAEL